MSHRFSFSIILAAVGLGLASSQAAAADLDPGYAQIPRLQEEKVEFGSGWYIRGDIGATRGLAVKAGDEPYDSSLIGSAIYANRLTYNQMGQQSGYYRQGVFDGPGTTPPSILAGSSSNLLYNASLGGGYQFSRWFRADATVDFRQPVSNTYQGATNPCITGTSGITDALGIVSTENIVSTACTPTLKASLKSFTALVNGYVDLGTYSIVTPYVGAGIGLSFGHASTSSTYYQNNTQGYAGVSYLDAVSKTSFYQNFDRSQSVQYYNLAFALMGGVAFDVADHTKFDIGYRYLHLGQVLGTNLNAQEVRAGLRYMIDN